MATKAPEPTEQSLEFVNFLGVGCGVTFLYPRTMSVDEIASTEAILTGARERMYLLCDKERVMAAREQLTILTPKIGEAASQKIKIYEKTDGVDQFVVYNPQNGKYLLFETTNTLTSLVLKTLEFIR